MFLGRFAFFLFRLLIYRNLGLLHFFSKPGSRLIIPALLVAAAIFARTLWHELITGQLRLADPGLEPEIGVLDVVLVVVVVVASVAYVILSKLLAIILGAFPVPVRPLAPLRKLEPTKTEITPAVVRISVPRLPRQRN